jgi:hypothetical protein
MGRQDDEAIQIARTLRDLHELLHGPRAWALSDADRRLLQDLVVKLEEVLAQPSRCAAARAARDTRRVALYAAQRPGPCDSKQRRGGPP